MLVGDLHSTERGITKSTSFIPPSPDSKGETAGWIDDIVCCCCPMFASSTSFLLDVRCVCRLMDSQCSRGLPRVGSDVMVWLSRCEWGPELFVAADTMIVAPLVRM
eukprot:TRINITY_DN3065_c0_g1_i1.p1 TRINITY_DN3065_c0_g1~~TRINITY_DN3065_c0_g1_i1.p1  ORF type:complete len:106 (+),score=11.90 TRINITY_DN3065_c0_g1_i1:277-594(+)